MFGTGLVADRTSPMTTVGFLRPRMGIGGSERLVTDAAVALKQRGHRVTMFVPDRAPVAQFPELAEYHIQSDTHGAFLPPHIGGRLRVPLAVVRTAYAAWHMSRGGNTPQVVFSDVVPHVIPLLKRLTDAMVLYFCHFPDLLLTPDGSRENPWYRAYRRPLDGLEERGIAAADLVLTNSKFTAEIVRRTFSSVGTAPIRVLYPGVAVPSVIPAPVAQDGDLVILSVNRFDPRKNLNLAIDALASLRSRLPARLFSRVCLVLAGHYDRLLPEAFALTKALERRVLELGLAGHVRFQFSPSEAERQELLARCRCLVYTPVAEHFGYGPVEAMAAGRPVVAVNHGGPTETVVDGTTGFLCAPNGEAFGAALEKLIMESHTAAMMGRAGHDHIERHFSLGAFGDNLDALVTDLALRPLRQSPVDVSR
jgi:alpha-1,3/alpha-1,6-mannosyltransferase